MRLNLFDDGIDLLSFAKYCKGVISGKDYFDLRVRGISTDSRNISEGDVFFAIKGDNFDGYDYIDKAMSLGAVCVVTEKALQNKKYPHVLVKDTRKALGAFAEEYKKIADPFTVAVTGSVGKTTTKQFIYSILSTKLRTVKTEGNLNNDIGLPMTILSLEKSTEALTVEMGMSARGEISHLSKTAHPNIGVITNIGNAHIENLGSRENIRDAKMEIVDGMSSGGILILNGDEPLLLGAVPPAGITKLYFGISNPCVDFLAENIRQKTDCILFDVCLHNHARIYDLKISGYGTHRVYDALAAVACGLLMNIGIENIRAGLMNFEPVALRQTIKQKDGFTLIEDCYNAGPESMQAAIETLCGISTGRKIAVLGDMKELGPYSSRLHFLLGEKIASTKIDMLVTIGPEAIKIARGAYNGGMSGKSIISIEDPNDPGYAATTIKGLIRDGDTVLIKASRALALERISNLL